MVFDFSFALIIIQHKHGSKNLRLTASSNKNTTFILTTDYWCLSKYKYIQIVILLMPRISERPSSVQM